MLLLLYLGHIIPDQFSQDSANDNPFMAIRTTVRLEQMFEKHDPQAPDIMGGFICDYWSRYPMFLPKPTPSLPL